LLLLGGDNRGCDGCQLADFNVGQDREEMVLQVVVMSGPCGFEGRHAVWR
jgi:hypothetical protein